MKRFFISLLLACSSLVNAQMHININQEGVMFRFQHDKEHMLVITKPSDTSLAETYAYDGNNFVAFPLCFTNSGDLKRQCIMPATNYPLNASAMPLEALTSLQTSQSSVRLLEIEGRALKGYNQAVMTFYPNGFSWWNSLGDDFKKGGQIVFPF